MIPSSSSDTFIIGDGEPIQGRGGAAHAALVSLLVRQGVWGASLMWAEKSRGWSGKVGPDLDAHTQVGVPSSGRTCWQVPDWRR